LDPTLFGHHPSTLNVNTFEPDCRQKVAIFMFKFPQYTYLLMYHVFINWPFIYNITLYILNKYTIPSNSEYRLSGTFLWRPVVKHQSTNLAVRYKYLAFWKKKYIYVNSNEIIDTFDSIELNSTYNI